MSTGAASALLDAGYLLLPTAVFHDGLPDRRNDVHFDLVVLAAAGLPPPGMSGSKAERGTTRAELLPAFERVLEFARALWSTWTCRRDRGAGPGRYVGKR